MNGRPRKALIFGVTGQDGAYLAAHLLGQGYQVHGTTRNIFFPALNLRLLGLTDRVRLHAVQPVDPSEVAALIEELTPDEIYNLAGQSSVGLSFSQPAEAFKSHAVIALNVLEAMRVLRSKARFYNASSGECFGETGATPADQTTPFRPRTPYGVAKTSATLVLQNYREIYDLFACVGFAFNHESPLRQEGFFASKVVRGAIDIAHKRSRRLELGNLQSVRDWGWVPDFVEAMHLMLQKDAPEDFVISTGIPTSSEEFVERVFSHLGLDWKDHVTCRTSLTRPKDIGVSFGNPERARAKLEWSAKIRMPELAGRLVEGTLNNRYF